MNIRFLTIKGALTQTAVQSGIDAYYLEGCIVVVIFKVFKIFLY